MYENEQNSRILRDICPKKIIKMPKYFIIFAQKFRKCRILGYLFYMAIARKIFSRFLEGVWYVPHFSSLSPAPMATTGISNSPA